MIGGHQAVRTRVIADISVYTAGFQINASAQYNSLRKIRGSGDRADADNPAVVLAAIDPERPDLPDDVKEQVNIEIKYEGYIDRQKRQVAQFEKAEKRSIPEDIDYDDVKSLRLEARQKLKEFRPENVGQASRIAGVSPADISVLLVYLKQLAYRNRK